MFIPLTVGGGVRTVADVRRLLNAGADKVSFNSAAVADPQVIGDASAQVRRAVHRRRHRRQAARAAARPAGTSTRTAAARNTGLDAVRVGAADGRARRRRDPAHQHGPRRHQERLRPRADARRRRCGAGAGDRLGRRRHARSTWLDGIRIGGADAVLAASIFHYGEFSVREAKAQLARDGIAVRL